jgi:hypothetical protein
MSNVILPGLPKPARLIKPLRSDRCGLCFWAEMNEQNQLECHKNPPSVTVVASAKGILTFTSFAIMQPNQWCGAHKPKLNGAQDAVQESRSE